VPYSVHLNDIASFDFPGFSPADYEQQLVDEFEQLYGEGVASAPDDGDRVARTSVRARLACPGP